MDTLDYYKEVIDIILKSSESITEYMILKYGVDGVNDFENYDLRNVYTECLKLLLEELHQIGIEFNETTDLEYNSVVTRVAILLRYMFDKKELNIHINSSETIKTAVHDYINDGNYNEDLFITGLIETLFEVNKLSLNWEFLHRNRFTFKNTDKLLKHVSVIMDKDLYITDDHADKISRYIVAIVNHVNFVRETVQFVLSNYVAVLDYSMSDFDFKLYDVDLNRIPVEYIDIYLDESDPHPVCTKRDGDIDFITSHKKAKDHHFNYYIENGNKTPTFKQIVVLFAEYLRPHLSIEQNMEMFTVLTNKASFKESDVTILKDLVNLYFEKKKG
jgi:hypothetical protein